MRNISLTLLVVLGLLLPSPAAQDDPVHVTLRGPAEPVVAGREFDVTVAFDVDAPWHVYANGAKEGIIPTVVRGESATAGVGFAGVEYPADAEELVMDFGGPVPEIFRVWSHDFEVTARFSVAADARPGPAELIVELDYQTCDDTLCLPPTYGRELALTVEVVAGNAAVVGVPGGGSPTGLALADVVLAGPAKADHGPVHLAIRGPDAPVAPGSSFEVQLQVTIDPPYHLYAAHAEGEIVPTRVSAASSLAGVSLSGVRYPAESEPLLVDYGSGLETFDVLSGSVEITATFTVAADAAPGAGAADLSVDFMACDDRNCLLPVYATPLSVAFEVGAGVLGPGVLGGGVLGGGDGAAGAGDAGAGVGAADRGGGGAGTRAPVVASDVETLLVDAIKAGDILTVIVLSVLAAFAALLTPCVFPMIPITVSFFAKRAEAAGGRGAPKYALAYGFGIIATYTGFGLILALATVGAAQAFATNPWVNFAIGALFVYFGFSLLGFYDLKPPAFLTRAAEKGMASGGKGGQSYLSVIVMGFVFTVTAFTCTAPVVGTLLASMSRTGEPAMVVLSMLAFSTAFALPFVLLALFPNALATLPSAGGWMITVKATLGFLEIIASLKFFSNTDLARNWGLLPRPTMLVATMLLTSALGLYLLGLYRLPHDVPGGPGRKLLSGRNVVAALILLFTLYLSQGLTGRLLNGWVESYLPPSWYGVPEGERSAEHVDWLTDRDTAFAKARGSGANVFIDFTGAFCINCRLVEADVFSKAEFADELEARGIVPLQLYTDRRDPGTGALAAVDAANQAYMVETFNTFALPFYALMSPEGEILRRMPNPNAGDRTVEHFVEFLEDPRQP